MEAAVEGVVGGDGPVEGAAEGAEEEAAPAAEDGAVEEAAPAAKPKSKGLFARMRAKKQP